MTGEIVALDSYALELYNSLMQTTTTRRRGVKSSGVWSYLVEARESAGLTQGGLSAVTGFRQQQISRWEHGKAAPPLKAQKALAQALKKDLNEVALAVVNFFRDRT